MVECLGLPLDGLPPESGLEEAVRPAVRPTLLPVCLRSPAVGRPDLEVGLPVLLASLVELPVEEALLAVLRQIVVLVRLVELPVEEALLAELRQIVVLVRLINGIRLYHYIAEI